MNQAKRLIKIGSNAKVDIGRIKDRISSSLREVLTSESTVKVVDYKMTDGGDIGVVVELKDGSSTWFFKEELEPASIEMDISDKISEASSKNELTAVPSTKALITSSPRNSSIRKPKEGKEIRDMLNPLRFINWLLYSLKDVF